VYCTNAIIKRVGGAVAVSLEDATLPGSASNKHMTIMYRRRHPWTNDEIAIIAKAKENWLQTKYESTQAPITFTIEQWGNKSVKINGDLAILCMDLRKQFGSMSASKQRVPHCELFKGQKGKRKCHVCKGGDHLRKECPRKQAKKQYKTPKRAMLNDWPTPKVSENGKGDKLKWKLEQIIVKTQEVRKRKERELQMFVEKENDLLRLLNDYDSQSIDDKVLRTQIKQIGQAFSAQRKVLRKDKKKMRKQQKRMRKKEKKMNRREKKRVKRDNKKKNESVIVFDDEKKEEIELNNDETMSASEETEDGSSTDYSEGGDDLTNDDMLQTNEVEGSLDDEFVKIFEGF